MIKPILRIKIYNPKDRIPKLRRWHNSKQLRSRDCLVYWEWVNFENRVDKVEPARIGWLIQFPGDKPEWQVSGITGDIRVLGWGYIKKLK